jgi:hypothetical protein
MSKKHSKRAKLEARLETKAHAKSGKLAPVEWLYERWLADALAICEVLEVSDATSASYAEVRLELRRAGTPIAPTTFGSRRSAVSTHLSRDEHFDLVDGVRRVSW